MDVPPDLTIDTSGTYCPVPIIETAKMIRTMNPGAVLLVIATDPGVEPDMKAWCKSTGNELLGISRQGKSFRCMVRKPLATSG